MVLLIEASECRDTNARRWLRISAFVQEWLWQIACLGIALVRRRIQCGVTERAYQIGVTHSLGVGCFMLAESLPEAS